MKNILRKSLYIILMVTMIITSFTPYNTKADNTFDGAHSQVVPATEDEYKKSQDGVTVSKHITKNDKENYFDIELQVITQSEVKTISTPPASVAVELVIDNSSSMNFCMSKPGQSKCSNSSDYRMAYLKAALKNRVADGAAKDGFIQQFVTAAEEALAIDPNVKRELGIVTFNRTGDNYVPLTTYKSGNSFGNNQTFYNYFSNKVTNITNGSGTNPAEGLRIAREQLNNSDAQYKYIIFLTDGYPTVYKQANGTISSVTGTYEDRGAIQAREQAEINKSEQYGIQTFSIGVGVDQQPPIINGRYDGTGSTSTAQRGQYQYEVGYQKKVIGYEQKYEYKFTGNTINTSTQYILAQSNTNNSQILGVNDNSNGMQTANLSSTALNNNFLWTLVANGNNSYYLHNVGKNFNLRYNSSGQIRFGSRGSERAFTPTYENGKYSFSTTINGDTYYLTSNGELTTTKSNRGLFYLTTYTAANDTTKPIYEYRSDSIDFGNWLGGYANDGGEETTRGIGYNSDDKVQTYYELKTGQTDLSGIYNSIFETIKTQVEEYSNAWKVEDSMNSNDGVVLPTDVIEFLGFYDNANENILLNANGTPKLNSNQSGSDNSFEFKNDAISWDLRNSTPTETKVGTKTYYTYTLNYRVRLKNENPEKTFTEEEIYHTNGSATLHYYNVTKNGNDEEFSDVKTIDFYNPEVVGRNNLYVFNKLSGYSNINLDGALFRIYLNKNGDNTKNMFKELVHIDENYEMTASAIGGEVRFANIPSGYDYIMEEVTPPQGYAESMVGPFGPINDLGAAQGYGYTKEIFNNDNDGSKKYYFTIVDGSITNSTLPETIYNFPEYKKLVIRKEVKPNDENNKNAYIDNDREFSFTINVDDTIAKYYEAKSNNESIRINLNNQKGTFKLKNNEEIEIYIPYGVHYEIEESEHNGYTVIYDGNEEGTINLTNSKVVVTNKKEPTKIIVEKKWENVKDYAELPKVEVKLQKSLDGKTWEDAKSSNGTVYKVELSSSNNYSSQWNNLDGDYAYRVVETNIIGEDPSIFKVDYKYEESTGTWTITNTDTRIVVLPEAGSSGGLILASLAFVFITMPVMYTAYNLYIDKRWF